MKLRGQHILLRAAEPSDVDAIFDWENDPSNWLVSGTVAPYSKHQIQSFIENNNDVFVSHQLRLMIQIEYGKAIGCVDFFDFDPKNHHIGMGILIDTEYRGKGYGIEAIGLACEYGFDMLELRTIYAEVLESNESSLRLFEKNGFERKGLKTDWLWDGQSYQNQIFLQKIKVD